MHQLLELAYYHSHLYIIKFYYIIKFITDFASWKELLERNQNSCFVRVTGAKKEEELYDSLLFM